MKRSFLVCLLVLPFLLAATSTLLAQGVTTGSIRGSVADASGAPVVGAQIAILHQASGTRYGTFTREDGRFFVPGMRVGGPYSVTVTHIGFETQVRDNVYVNLGVSTDLDFSMRETAFAIAGITVTALSDPIINSERTGAATAVGRETLETLPTITRDLSDFTRLSPHFSPGSGERPGMSFAGQHRLLNNITVDGSYFNNSFGLGDRPGDRTNVSPISLDAIEQVQINVAPFDVRHGNFVGGSVNTVTRSGTNQFRGSLYYQFREPRWSGIKLVGTEAKDQNFNPGTFDFSNVGGWVSGPILKNKLFFFASYEDEGNNQPGTTFRANTGGETVGGIITRVRASSLDSLSAYLKNNFGYETGPYQGYQHETPGTRYLFKLDYNLNERNRLSVRYTHLDSFTDVLLSNSTSLGAGSRRTSTSGLNFQNSNYQILENIRSIVGEWNSMLGANWSNNLIIGYTHHDESRASRGQFFPMVDILDGSVYTTFGFEPFTPNNELRYWSFQGQNNLTRQRANHTLTFGVSAERYESENVFFPGSQSVYVYNSLDDFYTDANDHLAKPDRTTSPVTLNRFQLRWMNLPNREKPVQPLEVFYAGVYAQDEWQVKRNLRLTAGLRLDVPFFGETGFQNTDADTLVFLDADGNAVRYSTAKLPDANIQISPRVGFNWDVFNNRETQVRGGTGIFSGRPAYVWISNQIGNTGVLTGFESRTNTTARPFHPDPNHYKPTNVTGAPASSYELALTEPDFVFPQTWRSNIGVDQRLPYGFIGTAEFLYSKDVNGVNYINANLPAAQTRFEGADNRLRWTDNRIHDHVANAVVLQNQNEGHTWSIAASLEKTFSAGLYAKAAYSYGVAKNTVTPGFIASGTYFRNAHSGDPNKPGVGFAEGVSPGHRVFLAASYRREYFDFGATTIGVFWQGRTQGNFSYTFSGDMNGDGGANDLIYIHRNLDEMNFETFTSSGKTFTKEEQAAAWDAFIEQDDHLREHRGEYAERGAVFLPMVFRADLSVTQELFRNLAGHRNGVQLRLDILNFGNLLSKDWGVGQQLVTTSPLIARGADAEGKARYRLRNLGPELISESLDPTAGPEDVYRIQLSLRYTFN
ncbi:MAG: TonB-dependent receptor [Gemmatimonadetes bacterium]|nr:TonB-dependent receptor [Gemmatimonadota bacterium]